MAIRTLVVSRAADTVESLRSLLERESDVELVLLCPDAPCTSSVIAGSPPDLVFLDTDLADADSFELAASLPDPAPLVVFVSAHDHHARRAFDANALDYLLAPVDGRRLHATLVRARDQLAWRDAKRRDRILVRVNGRVLLLNRGEIDRVESAGNYLKLFVGASSHLVRRTMTQMERDLGADRFIRIHRSHLVNVDRICELQPSLDGDCTVVLRGGTRLTMSRGYRERVQQHLGGLL